MCMTNEFPAYFWQWLRKARPSTEEKEEGGDGPRRRGVASVQTTILKAGWCGLLAQLHESVRSVEAGQGSPLRG